MRHSSVFLCWLTCSCVPLATAAESDVGPEGDWGTITGRVIFAGMLNDPVLKEYERGTPIYPRRSILEQTRDAPREGEGPVEAAVRRAPRDERPIGYVPNDDFQLDKKTLGIANALVYLKQKPARIHPSLTAKEALKPLDLVCRDRKFVPKMFVVQVGQKLRMTCEESSPPGTNFKSDFFDLDNFNIMVPMKSGQAEWTFKKKSRAMIPSPIVSNLHLAARSYCLVTDHPYTAVTNKDGSFRINHLPAGDHKLTIWHSEVGYVAKSLRVTVRPGEIHELEPQELSAERLREASR